MLYRYGKNRDLLDWITNPGIYFDDLFRSVQDVFEQGLVEEKDHYLLELAVTGFSKDEVEVEVLDGQVLKVSAQKKKEHKNKSLYSSTLSRQFSLPENTDLQKIEAKVENGLCVVILPKLPEQKPEEKRFKISLK